jgi:hypothetical protein
MNIRALLERHEVNVEPCGCQDLERRDNVKLVESVEDEDLDTVHTAKMSGLAILEKWHECRYTSKYCHAASVSAIGISSALALKPDDRLWREQPDRPPAWRK